ncbi:hypothetical protein HET69_22345 [Streptomyces sp. CJ_13]|uniref:VCBS repeat-containing protein n=1 Tax=Streptomyces TaxID=1883 RepID=UPI001BDBF0DB|nr:VCBS repeat-containing protein [Streptomyces sp. CJ_13]MBT1186666.1 hypothetical protein [Streptomyces sp. CJ_13]
MRLARSLPIAAVSLALGLTAVSPATAATAAVAQPQIPGVTAPQTFPAPGFAGEDRYAGCDTDPYAGAGAGWIGLDDPTFQVTTGSPSGTALQTTFQLWDTSYGGKRTEYPASWSVSGKARTTVPRQLLKDGGQYAWRARATDGTLTSPYTAWCHFRVDQTQPTAEVTTDASPKEQGKEASFTLKATDTGSGIACARWSTSGTPSVGWRCSDAATDSSVVRLTDGTATVKVTPAGWGTQAIYLQTMDNAGNVSQLANLFYSARRPAAPATFGDIDADGRPDVLVPDSAGDLRKMGSDPQGPAHADRAAAPGGADSWAKIQYTHRGSLSYQQVDDLLAHTSGDARLYAFQNNGGGRFTTQRPNLVSKPTTCLNSARETIACGAYGLGSDWSKVTQIAAYGSAVGDSPSEDGILPSTSVLFVENGRLWLTRAGSSNNLDDQAVLLSANDERWAGYDLLSPGRAQGTDFPTLWARSQADGTIRAFTIAGRPDAPKALDSSAFADPAAGPVLGTLAPAAHPRIGSDGDLTGDGIPDLWSADASGEVWLFPGTGTAAPHPTVTGFASIV